MDGAPERAGSDQDLADRAARFNLDVGTRFPLRNPLGPAVALADGDPDVICDCVLRLLRTLVSSMQFYANSVRRCTRAARVLTVFLRRHLRAAREARAAVVERWRADEKLRRDDLRCRIQEAQRRQHTQTSSVLVSEYGQIIVDDAEKPLAAYVLYLHMMRAHRARLRHWYLKDPRGKVERQLVRAVTQLESWKHALRPEWLRTAAPRGLGSSLRRLTQEQAAAVLNPDSSPGAGAPVDEVCPVTGLRDGELRRLCSTATHDEMPSTVALRRQEALAKARSLRQQRPRLGFIPGKVLIEELITTARALEQRAAAAGEGRCDAVRLRSRLEQSELAGARDHCAEALCALHERPQVERRASLGRRGSLGRVGSFGPKKLVARPAREGSLTDAPGDGLPPLPRRGRGPPRRVAHFVLSSLRAMSPDVPPLSDLPPQQPLPAPLSARRVPSLSGAPRGDSAVLAPEGPPPDAARQGHLPPLVGGGSRRASVASGSQPPSRRASFASSSGLGVSRRSSASSGAAARRGSRRGSAADGRAGQPAAARRAGALPAERAAEIGAKEQRARAALLAPEWERREACGRRAVQLGQDAARAELCTAFRHETDSLQVLELTQRSQS